MKMKGDVGTRLARLLGAALVLLALGCQQPTRPTATSVAAPAASGAWDAYVSEFLESHFAARPHHAVWAGRHEFDGKLPDLSAGGIKKDIQCLHAVHDRVSGFADSSLNDRQWFERRYLEAAIDRDLFWLESAEWPFVSPGFYGSSLDPNVYVSREYAPLEQRMRAYTRYAKAIPAATVQIPVRTSALPCREATCNSGTSCSEALRATTIGVDFAPSCGVPSNLGASADVRQR